MNMRFYTPFLMTLSLTLVAPLFPAPAMAEGLTVDITRGYVAPMRIAILPFETEGTETTQMAEDVVSVITQDLTSTGLFAPIPRETFIQKSIPFNALPRFGDWRIQQTEALVSGRVTRKNGLITVEFRLWDPYTNKQLQAKTLTLKDSEWRRAAHISADAIYQTLTGEPGHFDTRIVYVSETGPATKRTRRLAVMDYDGENHSYLTSGQTMVMTPRFSPTVQQIAYLSFAEKQPKVYIYDFHTGQRMLLGHFPGMTFAPRFAPDGKSVIFSQSLNGNTSIYTMDLKTKQTKRLTHQPVIDTSPSYSPDASKIAFTSDRSGQQQLYVMNADGSNPQRISFGKGAYSTPAWSPRGDLIAFTKYLGNKFYIGVMKPDGSGERLITDGYLVEGPTWAPNGRVLLYTRENRGNDKWTNKKSNIYMVDITGRYQRPVQTPTSASDPAWSPLIPVVEAGSPVSAPMALTTEASS